MAKIKPHDTQEEVMKKILSGKATLEAPFLKELESIWELEAFLNQYNKKLPPVFRKLEKELHKINLNWKPF